MKKYLPSPQTVLVLLIGAVLLYDHLPGTHTTAPASDAAFLKLGRDFIAADAASYGDGWVAAAYALEKGATVEDAQKALQVKWSDSHKAAFARVTPDFERLLPAGTEPSSADRQRVADAWAAFGRGLKGERR